MTSLDLIKDVSPLKFPFRVNFVMQSLADWRDIAAAADAPNPDDIPQRLRHVDSIWIGQSYLRLKRRGHDVRLVDRFIPGEVCVALGALRASNKPYRSFVIAAQTHLLKSRICDVNLVQNEELLERDNEYFMIHWPQPGLIARDASRGDRIERVGYFGDESLSGQLTSPSFLAQLEEMGLTLITPEQWNDYSEVDVVLAIRNVPPAYTRYKPPSKLMNAWAAGCAALMGPEQAFAALKQNDLDYIEVKGPRDVIAALRRLQSEPGLYRSMIANGRVRSPNYNADAVARRWEELLAGPVADRYRTWLSGPKPWRAARNFATFGVRFMKNRKALRDIDQFNLSLKQTGYDWGKTGGASMPPEPVVASV